MQDSQCATKIDMGISVAKDTVVVLPRGLGRIDGLSVDMDVSRNRADFVVRILLEDESGNRLLAAESYREMDNTSDVLSFKNYCEETGFLDGVTPVRLHVYVKNATVNLSALHIIAADSLTGNRMDRSSLLRSAKRMQVQEKVNRINDYNQANNKLWRAGVTSMSLRNFSDKMRLMGFSESASTGGLEYYIGGIFEMEDDEEESVAEMPPTRFPDITFVDSFDWRNRHGKNWMTSVKDQGDSGYCSAFAAVSTLEALANLYFNQKLDLDLSEQEAACCNAYAIVTDSVYFKGMSIEAPVGYMITHGVCDEDAYPFVDSYAQSYCRSDSIAPNELVGISVYGSPLGFGGWESIKEQLIKGGPLVSGFNRKGGRGHAMSLVGYGVIHAGDTIYFEKEDSVYEPTYTIPSDDPRVGSTYWIFKDNYIDLFDYEHNNYLYLMFQSTRSIVWPIYMEEITRQNHTDSEIVCEDADGDGLYFWGLGDRPSSCPTWIPYEKDGDDSNPSKGKMLTSPVYGELENLGPFSGQVYSNNTSFTSRTTFYNDIVILNNVTLTINDIFNLLGHCRIYIQDGGHLIIDGGVLTNAKFILQSGSKITLKNGGKIVMRTNTDFEAPVGAILDITHGEIIGSNNF